MADVTACVGEYRLCCQPGVSLMKIGIQVSCHSFSMSERGAGEHFSLFFFPLALITKGRTLFIQTGRGLRGENDRQRERERESEGKERERVSEREGGGGRERVR